MLTYFTPFSSVSIIKFEQVNVSRINDAHPKKINWSLQVNHLLNEYKNTLSLRHPREYHETDFNRPSRDLFKVNMETSGQSVKYVQN